MSLAIAITEDKSFAKRVALTGRLDANTAPELEESLDQLISESIGVLIFDLTALEYISSAGLRVIFKTTKAMHAKHGKCGVLNMQPQIQKVFEIVKALPEVPVFKNNQEMDNYLDAMQQETLDKYRKY